jgi:hypothetical protein
MVLCNHDARVGPNHRMIHIEVQPVGSSCIRLCFYFTKLIAVFPLRIPQQSIKALMRGVVAFMTRGLVRAQFKVFRD